MLLAGGEKISSTFKESRCLQNVTGAQEIREETSGLASVDIYIASGSFASQVQVWRR